MEIFTIYKEPNEFIYKGSEFYPLRESLNSNPLWFGDLKTAVSYGKFVYKYKPTRRLKLIDLTNHHFHLDFMNKVNKFFQNNHDFDIRNKAQILIPLGLPDFETQKVFLNKKNTNISNLDTKKVVDLELPFFFNKHRYSVFNLDRKMALFIKNIYPSFDGFISELLWPSYYHEGFFGREICVFDSNKTLNFLGKIDFVKEGGSSSELLSGFSTDNKHQYDKYIIHQPEKMYWNMKEYKYFKKLQKLDKDNHILDKNQSKPSLPITLKNKNKNKKKEKHILTIDDYINSQKISFEEVLKRSKQIIDTNRHCEI